VRGERWRLRPLVAGEEQLTGGKFYGSVVSKQAVGGAIFTELQHSEPRKLPAHSHELPFFSLVFGRDYAEKYGRRDVQFRRFTFAYRPAGVPHQDEVGPRGARMFGIEVEHGWQRSVKDGSGDLGIACDFEGGLSLWLALKLYLETRTPIKTDDLQVVRLVSELLGCVAHKPERLTIAPYWLRRVKAKLNADYRERITMDELASEAACIRCIFREYFANSLESASENMCTGCAFARIASACSILSSCWRISVAI